MLKKIIALCLSCALFASSAIVIAGLQPLSTTKAAMAAQWRPYSSLGFSQSTNAQATNTHVVMPYMINANNVLCGGVFRLASIQQGSNNASYIVLEVAQGTHTTGSTNFIATHINAATADIYTRGLWTMSGSGTADDPYVVLGL